MSGKGKSRSSGGWAGALGRLALWLIKAAIGMATVVILIGNLGDAFPKIDREMQGVGLGATEATAKSFVSETWRIICYLVTEHWLLGIILIAGAAVFGHILLGEPTRRSRVEYDKRREFVARSRKGRKK